MLEIRDLVKVYPGPVAALKGLTLEIPAGMFGLLGPNGAGKSTLMQILAGLLEPTSGAALLDGVDLIENPAYVRARLGYLPQSFGFYAHLTAEQMLLHLLRLKGVRTEGGPKRLARELLDRVGLLDVARRKLRGFSGGMRQRLGIAQAIAGDPRLIIVDEPTAGLDPEERLRFYRLLAELAENRIVVLSTHIVEDVSVLCSRFAIIDRGQIVSLTSPSAATLRLKGAIYEAHVEPAALAALSEDFLVTQAILVEGKNRVRIFLPRDRPPSGFRAVEPTLDDAYFTLMRAAPAPAAPAAPAAPEGIPADLPAQGAGA